MGEKLFILLTRHSYFTEVLDNQTTCYSTFLSSFTKLLKSERPHIFFKLHLYSESIDLLTSKTTILHLIEPEICLHPIT